jgi:hypothetical protein
MSASAGELNALATATVIDVQAALKPEATDAHYLLPRRCSRPWGAFACTRRGDAVQLDR